MKFHEARQAFGFDVPFEKISAAFKKVDQAALVAQARKRVRYEIWDGQKSINGLGPDELRNHLRQRGDWAEGGSIYLVYVDDKLRFMQPHPSGGGIVAMTRAEAIRQAQEHCDDLAEQLAQSDVLDAITDELLV